MYKTLLSISHVHLCVCGLTGVINFSCMCSSLEQQYNSSATHQVCSLILEGSSVVPASSNKRPNDGRGNYTPGPTTGDRNKVTWFTNTSKTIDNKAHMSHLIFLMCLPSVWLTNRHHLDRKASSSSAASSSSPLTHHSASDLQLPTLQ